ncbi:DUF2955 domain-containing protein [Motilimonas pumila]|uniref:DUF2955 domain-containing protein n=1 Tax=Motilimonas pumila TaxID=2303987 RepID=A0A418YKJ4_9GAMM|nr:DUF2955 domain-containing protein [Motilimonas pumila]RJG51487.1 DUF2955 domain-containing protein [Motilimonas pumila]
MTVKDSKRSSSLQARQGTWFGLPHYGLRVALTPWCVFVAGLLIDWKLSFVGAVFTSLFVLSPNPVPKQYAIRLIISSYVYMLGAWCLFAVIKPYSGVTFLLVFVAVCLSYYILVTRKDILTVVMALLGALLIPLQMRSDPGVAWELALWLPHNLVIAWLVSCLMFKLFPGVAQPEGSDKKEEPVFDAQRRWLRLSLAFLPFVAFAFITDNVNAFTLTYLAVQVTQFAASHNHGPNMIKEAMLGNIAGGVMAVCLYEMTVIAPFLPLVILLLLVAYGSLSKSLLLGNTLAPTSMTAFTVVCGVSFGPLMNDAEGKILLRISAAMGYIFIAMAILDRYLPDKLTAKV